MEQRISYGKNTPVSFRENLYFDALCPYRIRVKDFQNDDIAPLHYADTLELGLCCGIRGEVLIGGERLRVDGNAVYAATPGAVHATSFERGPGRIYVLHVSPAALKELVDLELLFRQEQKSIDQIPASCEGFEELYALVQQLILTDADPLLRTALLLQIFAVLKRQTPQGLSTGAQPRADSRELHSIIQWTESHFAEPIKLEQAAAVVGFTRNYFCSWFKANTHSTYIQYLNQVRINHACRVLVQSSSISRACDESGFRDMSYFIQIFRKTQGCTPKQYIRNFGAPAAK